MCGIFGYHTVDTEFKFPSEKLEMMAEKIKHRGPDGLGIYKKENVAAIGNVRLAIIDPEGGEQPFYSDDGSIILVQNGEIFNFRELKADLQNDGYEFKTDCDTEVLLNLYLRDGIDFLNKLNGMFALAIYHVEEHRLIIARDRIGEKPLYYAYSNGTLFFASEIKAFLPFIDKSIDFNAIDAFFNLNYIPPPLTGYKAVRHLNPGHYLEVINDQFSETLWWDLSVQKVRKWTTQDEWIEEFNELMTDCVDKRLVSDVPFGAFLSGGLDSSTVVGLMSQLMVEKVKTYTIGFPDKRFDESDYAEQAAVRFNTEHTMREVDYNIVEEWSDFIYHCDKPHGDVSFMPMRKVAEIASKDVKMVLTGDGADELFAGYEKYDSFINGNDTLNMDNATFVASMFKDFSLFSMEKRRALWKDEYWQKINPNTAETLFCNALKKVEHFDEINKMLYLEMRFLLSGNNLVKPDRMAMAESLETRAPFLDYRMMEFAFQTPGEYKLYEGNKKHLLKKAVAPLIGDNLAYRKKQMFTMPIGEWFKKTLFTYCEDLLLNENSKLLDYVNKEEVGRILECHMKEEENNTREIRALISFELWLRNFH